MTACAEQRRRRRSLQQLVVREPPAVKTVTDFVREGGRGRKDTNIYDGVAVVLKAILRRPAAGLTFLSHICLVSRVAKVSANPCTCISFPHVLADRGSVVSAAGRERSNGPEKVAVSLCVYSIASSKFYPVKSSIDVCREEGS